MDYILSFNFTSQRRDYRRDFVVPAPPGSSMAELVRRAQRNLPRFAEPMRKFLTTRNVEGIEGPTTQRRKTELR